MKNKIIAVCILGLIYSCKNGFSVIEDNEVKSSTASAVRTSSQDLDSSFAGFKPSSAYEMLFADYFFENNIEVNNAWWYPRTDSRTFNGFTGYNRAANNSVSNGRLKIKFDQDADGKYYGGGIISNKTFGYGYYEAKVKLYTGSYGLHQSFWSIAGSVEVDGFELDSKLRTSLSPLTPGRHRWLPQHVKYVATSAEQNSFLKVPNTNLANPPSNDDGVWTDNDGEWYTVGYEWLPGEIKYYINGQLINTYPVFDSFGNDLNVYQPANVYLTALPFKISTLVDLITPQPGANMQVEYFVYYAKKQPYVNLLGNGQFGYVPSTSTTTHPSVTSWSKYRLLVNGIETYAADPTCTYVKKENGNWFVEQSSTTKDYKAMLRQTLNYIPNGLYKFAAEIKCSAGGSKVIILDKDQNTILASRTINYPHSTWVTIDIDNIPINNHEVTILVYSDAKKNDYLQVDNVRFYQKP